MKYFKISLFVAIITILLFLEVLFFDFTVDDSLIGFRYAKNLAAGKGLVWNVGERVEGATDFLWTVIEAGTIKLGLNIEIWSKIMGILLSLFSVFLIYGISLTMLEKKNKKWAIVPAVFLGLTPALAFWAISGMGTLLFLTLTLLAVFFFIKEEKENWPYISGVFFALVALSRPEGIIFFGISFLYRAWRVYKKELKLKRFVNWSLLFIIIYVPYFIWRVNYFGYFFSNTYYAKKLFLGGVGYIFDYLLYILPFILLAGISIALKPEKIKIYLSLMFLILLVAISNVSLISGVNFRFTLVSLPFLYLLASFGIKEISERSGNKNKIVVVIIIAILIFYLINPFTLKSMRVYASQHMRGQEQLKELGLWLKENVPKDSLLVTEYAGAIPYYSGLRTLDMWGVVNEYVAHNGINIEYFLSQDPDIFVFSSLFEAENPGSKPGMKELNLLYKDQAFLKRHEFVGEWKYGSSKLFVYKRK